jgi:hypothetical protein
MTEHDRREFLKKLAKTAAYAAPVVYSLAAPLELIGAQMDMGHGSEMMMAPAAAGQSEPAGSEKAPGSQPAPWERPPPGGKVP